MNPKRKHRHRRNSLIVWTQSLTGSPSHQVELKCCGSQALAVSTMCQRVAHARKYIPLNQGQLPTSLIITLLALPAGLDKVTQQLGWCAENEEHLNSEWELDPFEKKEPVWSSTAFVLHFTIRSGKWVLMSNPLQKVPLMLITSLDSLVASYSRDIFIKVI